MSPRITRRSTGARTACGHVNFALCVTWRLNTMRFFKRILDQDSPVCLWLIVHPIE